MKRSAFLPLLIIISLVLIFFYPIFKGQIPFPGDLLVGHHAPYNTKPYGGYGPGAVPHKAQGPDVIAQLFPWKYFAVQSIVSGSIPFWNPHQFSGNPLLANFQTGALYPLNIIFLPSFITGWTSFILLIPVLSAFFLFLFLRELHVSEKSSIFGGIVFAFSSYMVVWMEYGNIGHTLLWAPLVLLLIEKLSQRLSWRTMLLLKGVLVLSFLAGYIQGYFYIIAVSFVYFLAKKITRKTFPFLQFLILGILLVLPMALGAFQLLPTFQLFGLSTRGNYSLDQIHYLLNPIWYTITTIVPDFFGNPASRNYWFDGTYIERVSYFGLIPFVLAVIAFVFVKKKEVRFFGVVGILTLFLATDFFITKYIFLLPIPVLSTTVPTRLLSLFVLSGSILAAFGLDYYLSTKEKRVFFPIMGVVVIVMVGWVVAVMGGEFLHIAPENLRVSLRNLVLPTLYLGSFIVFSLFLFSRFNLTKLVSKKQIVFVGIGLVTLFDLFYFFHKITPFSPKEYIYPETSILSFIKNKAGINRFWGYGSGYITSNFQTVDGTYSPDGNDPLHIKSYTEFLETSRDGKLPTSLPRPDANIAPGFGTGDLNGNPFRKKVINLLGVKYIVHRYDNPGASFNPDIATFDPDNYKLVWQETPWQVYENLDAAPRVFVTNSYEVVKNKEELFKRFHSKEFDETKTLLLYEDPKISHESTISGKATLLTYTGNKVTVHVKVDTKALLFLSDTHYPEWAAFVDGKKAPILTANHAFRAVVVPEGEHSVEFVYESSAFKNGVLLSFGSLLFLLGLLVFLKKKEVIE